MATLEDGTDVIDAKGEQWKTDCKADTWRHADGIVAHRDCRRIVELSQVHWANVAYGQDDMINGLLV